MSVDVIARDAALVLILSDFNPEISLYQPKSSSASISTSSRDASSREGSLRDTFETIDVEHIINYSFDLNLAGIGISIVNKRMQVARFLSSLLVPKKKKKIFDDINAGINLLGNGLCYYTGP